MLSVTDERQLAECGISKQVALQQLARFKKGFEPIELAKAATIGDGILKLSDEEKEDALKAFDSFQGSVGKFVPASGAATRMFKALFEFREESLSKSIDLDQAPAEVSKFFRELRSFAFFEELERIFQKTNKKSIDDALLDKEYATVLGSMLDEDSLGYGNLPKGLLTFHRNPEKNRTPAIEQVDEGVMHMPAECSFHFTVSPEFVGRFQKHLEDYLSNMDLNLKISYSSQELATDKIAVDLYNEIFRDEEGKLLLRPAGHGALLRNLNRIEEDIVFIKNIDNVLPGRLKSEVVHFKKVIAGVLLQYQKRVFDLLDRHDEGEDILGDASALLLELGTKGELSLEEIVEKLNRPIRVCGMVRNVGEPGGGPFWVRQKNDLVSAQIVEKAQVNLTDQRQKAILEESTHFNPVDLVCSLKNRNGENYDLMKFRDDETGFITEKSFGGRKLKAMELPGLWNGGMADWNTVFVEVPLATFSPVKTVNDLLKKEHQ